MTYKRPEMRVDGTNLMYGNVQIGEVYMEIDGYYVWVPSSRGGCYTGGSLQEIVDFLKVMNDPWDRQIKEYFSNQTD